MPLRIEISANRLPNLEVRVTVDPWGLAGERDLFVLWGAMDCSDVDARDEDAPDLSGFRMRRFPDVGPGEHVLRLRTLRSGTPLEVYACLGTSPPRDLRADGVVAARARG